MQAEYWLIGRLLLQNPFCPGYHKHGGGTSTAVPSGNHLLTSNVGSVFCSVGAWLNPATVLLDRSRYRWYIGNVSSTQTPPEIGGTKLANYNVWQWGLGHGSRCWQTCQRIDAGTAGFKAAQKDSLVERQFRNLKEIWNASKSDVTKVPTNVMSKAEFVKAYDLALVAGGRPIQSISHV